MTDELNPTDEFIAAASLAAMSASTKQPEIALAASSLLLDLAGYSRPQRMFDAAGHEVRLTQDMVTLTVQHSKRTEDVKRGVLDIFTKSPGFERLPEREYHR